MSSASATCRRELVEVDGCCELLVTGRAEVEVVYGAVMRRQHRWIGRVTDRLIEIEVAVGHGLGTDPLVDDLPTRFTVGCKQSAVDHGIGCRGDRREPHFEMGRVGLSDELLEAVDDRAGRGVREAEVVDPLE